MNFGLAIFSPKIPPLKVDQSDGDGMYQVASQGTIAAVVIGNAELKLTAGPYRHHNSACEGCD